MGAGKNAGFLLPFQVSTQQISTGRWSLSSRSNVPYVQLLGKNVNKVFTWGEVVEVPDGEICTLRNASYHAGDVWLNNGWDFDNRPARITVPVPFTELVTLFGLQYRTTPYPADVRMGRSAYFTVAATPNNAGNPINAVVIGRQLDGSHNTQNGVILFPFPSIAGAGYENSVSLPALTDIGYIPLGSNISPGNFVSPQALLTVANVFIRDLLTSVTLTSYYVVEY